MTPQDLIDHLRSRINPAYAAQIGTESHERRVCVEALEAQAAEIERLRTGDTCARQCEGTEYRIEARRLAAKIAKAPAAIMDTRDVLGICAPTEEDFPALYALQGKRVRLVIDDEPQRRSHRLAGLIGESEWTAGLGNRRYENENGNICTAAQFL